MRTGIVSRFRRRIEGIDANTYKENARFIELCAFLGLELEESEEDQVEDGDRDRGDVVYPDVPAEEGEESEPEVGPIAATDPGESKGVVPEVESGSEEGCVAFYTVSVQCSIVSI